MSILKQSLAKEFEVKDLGQLRYFLGMEVARSKEGIVVSQRKYILDLLKETRMSGCKPSDTPVEVKTKLGDVKDGVPVDQGRYQRLVGKLIYLSHTHPDIAFVVSMVSQFMHSLYEEHLEAVYKILRYLKSTPRKGLFFGKHEKRGIECVVGVWGASVAQGEEKGKAVDATLESLALLEEQIQGKKFFGAEKIGYLDIVAGWITHWLNVLEELGEMELLNAEKFPSLHEWGQNFIQTSPVKDCIPPREKVVDYFSFGINYVRSLGASKS